MSSPVYIPICMKCANFDKEINDCAVCKAYPNGIPYEVWKEKSKPDIDVNKPCNNDFMFQKRSDGK